MLCHPIYNWLYLINDSFANESHVPYSRNSWKTWLIRMWLWTSWVNSFTTHLHVTHPHVTHSWSHMWLIHASHQWLIREWVTCALFTWLVKDVTHSHVTMNKLSQLIHIVQWTSWVISFTTPLQLSYSYETHSRKLMNATCTGWQRPIGCLTLQHFSQKSHEVAMINRGAQMQ